MAACGGSQSQRKAKFRDRQMSEVAWLTSATGATIGHFHDGRPPIHTSKILIASAGEGSIMPSCGRGRSLRVVRLDAEETEKYEGRSIMIDTPKVAPASPSIRFARDLAPAIGVALSQVLERYAILTRRRHPQDICARTCAPNQHRSTESA